MSTENEKKGIVYEAFVKLAVKKILNIDLLWEQTPSGVIANQDFIYPTVNAPTKIFAVTQWGSHEAANKKYWRTIEDRFEVFKVYPEADFYSILFEKNKNSDDALDEQLRLFCFGRALSERNSSSIETLQTYVDSDEKIRSFGTGKDTVYGACQQLYKADSLFKTMIDGLGKDIKNLDNETKEDYSWCLNILKRGREISLSRCGKITISAIRDTYYKMAIIKLLRFNDEEISTIISAVNNNSWNVVSRNLKEQLQLLQLIKVTPRIAEMITVHPMLVFVANIGIAKFIKIKKQIAILIQNPKNKFYAYKDHLLDIIRQDIRNERYNYLFSCRSPEELLSVEHGIGKNSSNRTWVLDYFLALKRALTPRGKYGFKNLSRELGIKYTAGGVVSPLPRYASGMEDSINDNEKEHLYNYMFKDIQSFEKKRISDITIVNDRTITLMKKLNVIEMLINNSIRELEPFGCNIIPSYRMYSPLAVDGIIASAGATDYNFMISKGGKSAVVFVVSAYDASHKHKELSGRLRIAFSSKDYPKGKVKKIIVYDGILFGVAAPNNSASEKKIKMLYDAGWDYIYYVDELDKMKEMLLKFFSK